jgi:hypothetical protein
MGQYKKPPEQVVQRTQISLLQSRLAKIEQDLEQVSKAKNKSTQLSGAGETAPTTPVTFPDSVKQIRLRMNPSVHAF